MAKIGVNVHLDRDERIEGHIQAATGVAVIQIGQVAADAFVYVWDAAQLRKLGELCNSLAGELDERAAGITRALSVVPGR